MAGHGNMPCLVFLCKLGEKGGEHEDGKNRKTGRKER
jgi:hypothetical protein